MSYLTGILSHVVQKLISMKWSKVAEDLSQQERELIANLVRDGKPVPARYIPSISESPLETELIWPGKTSEVSRVVLPFQSIEHIDEPRKGTQAQWDLFSMSESTGRQSGGWKNKLIWGDNSLILSSLVNGPMREEIEKAGKGVIVYMNQEGRGIGLFNKLKAYKLQEEGFDTVDANLKLGFAEDEREYGVGAQILRSVGVKKMRLMTNNPLKRVGLEGYGLEMVENVPIVIPSNHHNEFYIKTKVDRMGHLFHL